MIRLNDNFNLYNKPNSKPVFVIEFNSITTKFASADFADIDSNYKKLINSINVIGAKIDPLRFNFSSYGFDFILTDDNDVVTGLFSSKNLMNNQVTVKIGFQELNIADFISFPPVWIIDYQFNSDYLTYKFQARDALNYLKKPIFQNIPETFLSGRMPIGNSHEYLQETNFTTHTKWDVAGDFNDTGGNAAYTGSAGIGSLTQTIENLLIKGKGGTIYCFEYDVSNVSGSPTAYINNISDFFVSEVIQLNVATNGTNRKVYFVSADDPGDFQIVGTGGAGNNFTLDNVSLIECADIALVDSITGFTAAASATWGESTDTYLKIGNEIVKYTASTTGQFTITRAQLGTNAQEHSKGEKVSEVFYVFTNLYQFLLEILQTSIAGSSGTYDLGLTGWGLGVSDYIDEIQIKNDFERYKFPGTESTERQGWVITKREDDGFDFIIENILKIIPAYFMITNDGKIGIRWWDLIINNEGYLQLNENNSNDYNITILGKDVVSYIEMYSEYNGGENDWNDIDEITYNSIPTAYGEQNRLIIKPYIYSGLATGLRSTIIQSIFVRYGNPPIKANVNTFLNNLYLQVGDVIDLSNSKLPIFNNGTKGWTRRGCEIVGNDIDFGDGVNINYEMLNFNTHEKVNLFSGSLFEEANIDDTNLTLNATGSDALQGDDAYIDTGLTSLDNYVVCTIQADLPAGSSGEENITLELRIQHTDTTNTDMEEKKIYYDPAKSGTQQWELVVSRITALAQTQRVKVDWIAESAGAGDKLTNVKFIKCKAIKWEVSSYTTTDLK